MKTKMQERNCTVQFRGGHNVARITLLVRFAQVAFKKHSGRIQTHETGREWRCKTRFEDRTPNVTGRTETRSNQIRGGGEFHFTNAWLLPKLPPNADP